MQQISNRSHFPNSIIHSTRLATLPTSFPPFPFVLLLTWSVLTHREKPSPGKTSSPTTNIRTPEKGKTTTFPPLAAFHYSSRQWSSGLTSRHFLSSLGKCANVCVSTLVRAIESRSQLALSLPYPRSLVFSTKHTQQQQQHWAFGQRLPHLLNLVTLRTLCRLIVLCSLCARCRCASLEPPVAVRLGEIFVQLPSLFDRYPHQGGGVGRKEAGESILQKECEISS